MAITALLPIISTGLQMYQSNKARKQADADRVSGERAFDKEFADLKNFQYTDPQAYADVVAESEKIAGAAQQSGDRAIREGILQNIEAYQRDPRRAAMAAGAVQQGGQAAFDNALRAAQYSMPYRSQFAQMQDQTKRANEDFQRGLSEFEMQRAAGSAERARQEEIANRQEMMNAALVGGSQLVDVLNNNAMMRNQLEMNAQNNDLMRELYGNQSSGTDTGDFRTYEGATGDTPITISQDVDPASVDPRSVEVKMPAQPDLDFGDSDITFFPEEASSNLGTETQQLTGYTTQEALDRMMNWPGGAGFLEEPDQSYSPNFYSFGGDQSYTFPSQLEAERTIDPAGVEYYNPGQSPAGRMMDILGGYGDYGNLRRAMQVGPPNPLQPPLPYSSGPGIQMPFGPIKQPSMLARGEEGMSLPMMTPGEPSHETNEQRLIDKQTGAPIADLMGAETVLNDKQTAQIEKDLKEGDKDGLFKFMKKLFNKPQFKKQRAKNGDYKGRKDMPKPQTPQAPQAPGPGGMADPRMAMMQAMMQGR